MSRTQIFAILSGLALLFLVLEMVRRRRLREEYSWIWLLTAVGYFLVAVWPALAIWVSRLIGSANPASAFTFLGLLFLFLLSIQFSVQISRLTEQNKDLAQQIAILDSELRSMAQDHNHSQQASAGSQQGDEVGVVAPQEDADQAYGHEENAKRADD